MPLRGAPKNICVDDLRRSGEGNGKHGRDDAMRVLAFRLGISRIKGDKNVWARIHGSDGEMANSTQGIGEMIRKGRVYVGCVERGWW